ncbi:MAG: tripartite tricarboxylate transporter TctB family protein [Synergistaceae bacterium]|jgi:hypothetical protein|nr:tripartite tricarboxylate transporter TctB family protein [Synergistaceae bacterium]
MKAKIHQDVFVGIFIIAVCATFLSGTASKPGDSMTFPIILLGLMAMLAVVVIIGGIKKTKTATAEKPIENSLHPEKLKTPLIAFLFIAAYVALFSFVGYFTATVLFLPALMARFGIRKTGRISMITVGFAVIIYALFVRQLNVPVLDFGYVGRLLSF